MTTTNEQEIFIALCCDRHCDPVIEVFTDKDRAITFAREFLQNHVAYPEFITESRIKGWEYFADYSEGDYARVTKGVLHIGTKEGEEMGGDIIDTTV